LAHCNGVLAAFAIIDDLGAAVLGLRPGSGGSGDKHAHLRDDAVFTNQALRAWSPFPHRDGMVREI
jgi:hypothetical protein